jgi:hypothetical protein
VTLHGYQLEKLDDKPISNANRTPDPV